MSSRKQILWTFFFSLAVVGIATGQDNTSSTTQKLSATITAAASGERVRIAAPSSVVQMHVEVYAASGEKLFDNEIRGGNVFDWHLQGGQAQRLSAGDYVCVVTVKNIAGRLTQKIGTVRVGEKDLSIAAAEIAQLSPQQSQAIGPIEENSSWTVLSENENQTTTVIAHDGADGQITRGRGALSFRLGDFFSGNDREQMRLTEEGSLGIGTSKPEAKLDVAGAVRARQGFVFNDGSTLNVNEKGALILTASDGTVAPNAAGTGTQNRLAKWLETGGAGTLGDSGVTELANGFVGIGTPNPQVRLDVNDSTSGVGGFQLTNNTNGSLAQIQNRLINNAGAFAYYGITSSGYTQAPILSNRAFFGSFQVDAVIWTQTANDILFATNGLSAATERMRIKSSGTVGIGTPSPQSLLDVNGDINTSTQYQIGGNAVLRISGDPSPTSLHIGVGAGSTNSGIANLFVGTQAGFHTGAGTHNSFVGFASGLNNITGDANAFFGSNSGAHNTSGSLNSFFGGATDAAPQGTGFFNTTGSFNSFFGHRAGEQNNGDSNSFFGTSAGRLNNSGSSNTFLGHDSGRGNIGGSFNTLIGDSADVSVDGLMNATAIGSKSIVSQSNSLVLGSINGVNNANADTNVGIGTTAPATRLHISGTGIIRARINSDSNAGLALTLNNQPGWSVATVTGGQFQIFNDAIGQNALWINTANNNVGIGTNTPNDKLEVNGTIRVATLGAGGPITLCRNPLNQISDCSSSLRYKTNVNQFSSGLNLIRRLSPITFNWKLGGMKDLGLGAEDVEKIEPLLVTYNDKGEVEGVKYDRVAVVLINAVKEQEQQISEQQEQIKKQQDALKQQRAQLAAQSEELLGLKQIVCRLQPKARFCK